MLDITPNQPLWAEKFRPRTMANVILPSRLKNYFQAIIDSGQITNMLFTGYQGVGKTTIPRALCSDMGIDLLEINASKDGNIDTLRTTIERYASTVSMKNRGGYKVVLLDEADYLNCFAGNQHIYTVNIDGVPELKSFDSIYDKTVNILSYNTTTGEQYTAEAFVFKSGIGEVYIVQFDDYSRMYCTKDHPFYTIESINGYCGVSEKKDGIKIGDKLVDSNGKTKTIVSMESLGMLPVYDLTTNDDNHNFILENGVVAHNCNSTQPALRNFMETYSANCRFILTANFSNRIMGPLKSRCAVVDFALTKAEKMEVILPLEKRMLEILDHEGVEYDRNVVAKVITTHFPDMRKITTTLQQLSMVNNRLDELVLTSLSDANIDELFTYLRDPSKWNEVRKWVVSNLDNSQMTLSRAIYLKAPDYVIPSSLPQLVLTLSDYDYKSNFVSDKELNIVAMLTELMRDLEFK